MTIATMVPDMTTATKPVNRYEIPEWASGPWTRCGELICPVDALAWIDKIG
jgi:hypothetical protein